MNYDKYKNTLPYPTKMNYTTIYIYDGGECVYKGNVIDCNNLPYVISGIKETILDEVSYKREVQKYREETTRLYELFKSDLEKEYGVENNPKKDLLFSKAWDRGHSGGFSDVASVYGDLVELIDRN